MSEDEDNMEIDGDDFNGSIEFSSGTTTKGKRIVADLPIGADDHLPWVEKYRPVSLDDVSGHKDILATINKFIEHNRLPHLLLYGPPGTGKTSTILALARKIYGVQNMRQMVLELNASDDRGIDVVRDQIKTFASTKQIFSRSGTGSPSSGGLRAFKLIILDEADAMTSAAQMALRRTMEKYTPNTRFCIIANFTHKLSPALLSRCTRFRFSPLKENDIRGLVEHVIVQEVVNIDEDAVDSLVRLSKGDMRRALNVLQACHAGSRPLASDGTSIPQTKQVEYERITDMTIYNCVAAPHPNDIRTILDTLVNTSDVMSCLTTVTALKVNRGLALADMLTSLADELRTLEVEPETRVMWLEGLSEIEFRLAVGGSETIQTGGMIGVLRRGCELTGATGLG